MREKPLDIGVRSNAEHPQVAGLADAISLWSEVVLALKQQTGEFDNEHLAFNSFCFVRGAPGVDGGGSFASGFGSRSRSAGFDPSPRADMSHVDPGWIQHLRPLPWQSGSGWHVVQD